jgi:hypothetical protein
VPPSPPRISDRLLPLATSSNVPTAQTFPWVSATPHRLLKTEPAEAGTGTLTKAPPSSRWISGRAPATASSDSPAAHTPPSPDVTLKSIPEAAPLPADGTTDHLLPSQCSTSVRSGPVAPTCWPTAHTSSGSMALTP